MSFAGLQNVINLSLGRFYLFETIGDCQSYGFDSLNGSVWLFWFSFDLSIIGDDVINWEICRFDQSFLDFTIILATHDDDDNLEAKRKNDDDDFDHREGFRELVFGSFKCRIYIEYCDHEQNSTLVIVQDCGLQSFALCFCTNCSSR